jgi:hypothetical protein
MHLFIDISSHGFGHLAISAPVLQQLRTMAPEIQITVRSGLSHRKLQERIPGNFRHIECSSDFGCVMHNATHVDTAATANLYRTQHANWAAKIEEEAALLATLSADLVLSNVSYLPLAGAARAGIPSMSICSLNWADIFDHYFCGEDWALPIHQAMLAAYRSAQTFLRITPGMPMPLLGNTRQIGPIATLGKKHDLHLAGDRSVLVSMGGIEHRLAVDTWPRLPGVRWLVSKSWGCTHPDAIAYEDFHLSFTDLLCSVDAVVTKPGYGSFAEAACNGIPVLYVRREDWPEQEYLIAWLAAQGRCVEISMSEINSGNISSPLQTCWNKTTIQRPPAEGALQAAQIILAALRSASRSA